MKSRRSHSNSLKTIKSVLQLLRNVLSFISVFCVLILRSKHSTCSESLLIDVDASSKRDSSLWKLFHIFFPHSLFCSLQFYRIFLFSLGERRSGAKKKIEMIELEMIIYRSVVDLTSSRFQSPNVNWCAVNANINKFTHSKIPIGA